MYPDDVQALFPLVPVGTPVRLINEPIKVAWVDGELLLEAHPPVDAEGQSFEPDVEQFSDLLQKAVGDSTVAIHWDYAREVLQKADGVIATVGLEAENPDEPPPASATASPAATPVGGAMTTDAAAPSGEAGSGAGADPGNGAAAQSSLPQ
jgi:L,D-transpeptidase ErfK/SrfK